MLLERLPRHAGACIASLVETETPLYRMRKSSPRRRTLAQRMLDEGRDLVPAEGNMSPCYRAIKPPAGRSRRPGPADPPVPLMLAVCWCCAVTTRGKPFYYQRRVGYRGRTFTHVQVPHHAARSGEDAAPGGERAGRPDLQEPPRSRASPASAGCSARPASTRRRNCSTCWPGRCRWSARARRRSRKSPNTAPGSAAAWPSCPA